MESNIIEIEINDSVYQVKLAKTEEEKEKGLQGVKSLSKNEGMLFVYDQPQTVGFWMKDTYIPLDIIFIDEEMEVISVYKGQPENTDIIEEDNVKYVLEVNQGSGIEEGDEMEMEDTSSAMQMIAPDGSVQMYIHGGERIISRKETRTLIKKAKKAEAAKGTDKYESLCKSLGKYIFKVINGQDNRDPEYVEVKDNN